MLLFSAANPPTIMAYSDNTSLLLEINETEVLALIDDEKVNFSSFQELVNVAGDSQDDNYATAVKQLQRLETARENADLMIDVYMRTNQTVPIADPPAIIRKLSNDMTIYYLYDRRMREGVPDGIKATFKTNLETLKELQKGFIRAGDQPRPAARQFATNKKPSDRVFNDSRLRGFS